jgi:hypothetical protein
LNPAGLAVFSLLGAEEPESMVGMELNIGRKTSAFLYFAGAFITLLLKLASPHYSTFSPGDAASVSFDVFSVIGYLAIIGLIVCGIRRLRRKDNSN